MQVISNRSITVDGVALKKGFNRLDNAEFNTLRRSAWRKKGIYEFVDVDEALGKDAEAEKPKDYQPDEPLFDYTELKMNELRAKAKEAGINTQGMTKLQIIDTLEGKRD
jgi:hypothetical protein